MIKTIKYSKVEAVTYKFTAHEIFLALIDSHKIKIGANDYTFDLYEATENDIEGAELIRNYKSKLPDKEVK